MQRAAVLARCLLILSSGCLFGCQTVAAAGSVSRLVGTWRLESRVDRSAHGQESVEPGLGRDPVALLVYDSKGNVSAQLMRRDRSNSAPTSTAPPDPNNSATQDGYDAYFGTYIVSGDTVTHVLEGALNPGDVGRHLTRRFRLSGDELTISFTARGSDGSEVTRILTWRREAP